jgi:hypothetical protein
MTTTTDTARAVLLDLETKLADARAHYDEAQSEAKEIAFAACTGEADARKRLDRLHIETAKISAEISSLEAALVEARRRVAGALASETDAAQLAKAQQAMEMVDAFTKRGAELDAALAAFLNEYAAMTADFYKLEGLGYAPTTWALVKMNMSRAVASALMFTDLRQAFLAPHERRNFVAVVEGWGRNVRMRATARLNSKAAAKAA